jgi:lysophospholipase L1-like esterase
MLARVDKDVIKKKPQWMLLSCGVNDVWHGKRGVALPDYKKNITAIVDKAQKAGIKVVIMTASMIREDAKNQFNTTLKD